MRACIALTLGALLAAAAATAAAQSHANGSEHGPSAHHAPGGGHQPGAAPAMEGQVQRVDREAARITIQHDAVPAMGMPAMTMVFHVQDAALLERAREGDKVRFRADRSAGVLTLVELDVVR